MMKRWLCMCVCLSLLLAGCQARPAASDELREVTLNLTYIPNIQFSPFYVAIEKGYFQEEGLSVRLNYGNEADFIALLGSGSEQFMIGSGEQVLLGRSQGLPVVSILEWYRDYPVGVASLKTADIQSPSDLRGKVIGLPGLYGANYIGFEALAGYAGLSESDYSLHSIGFTQSEALVSGQVDAAVIYLANEPILLEAQGYELNVLRVADYLALVGNCLLTNEETIGEDPELVHAMTRAVQRGIADVVAHPDEAFEISKKYVENLAESDPEVQQAVLAASIALWNTEGANPDSLTRWSNMQDLLLRLGLMAEPIEIGEAFTHEFLD
jgi:NitT/TauT family transport system substrate-binding protein